MEDQIEYKPKITKVELNHSEILNTSLVIVNCDSETASKILLFISQLCNGAVESQIKSIK